MNYEKMSDFEINKAVAEAKDYLVQKIDDSSMLGMTTKFHKDYPNTVWIAERCPVTRYQATPWEQYSPCNSPEDAWTIIAEHKISIINEGEWFAAKKKEGIHGSWDYYHEITNDNPLRAAMIVFLMMKEAQA